MKISFIDFWGDFDPNKNLITDICINYFENISVVSPSDCDVLFCGQFGSNHSRYSGIKKIFNELETWYKPNFNVFDYSIGFDTEEHGGKYFRIPCWVWNIDWFNSKYYHDTFLIPLDILTKEFFKYNKREGFASFVFSNECRDRVEIVETFKKYKNIDVYGSNGIILPRGIENKINVISKYKFDFCFENSVFSGSHTEKLIHSKFGGCVPVYKSHESYSIDFNPNCCLQVNGMSNEEIFELVKEYDNDEKKIKEIQEQPLFSKIPDINDYVNGLIKFL